MLQAMSNTQYKKPNKQGLFSVDNNNHSIIIINQSNIMNTKNWFKKLKEGTTISSDPLICSTNPETMGKKENKYSTINLVLNGCC